MLLWLARFGRRIPIPTFGRGHGGGTKQVAASGTLADGNVDGDIGGQQRGTIVIVIGVVRLAVRVGRTSMGSARAAMIRQGHGASFLVPFAIIVSVLAPIQQQVRRVLLSLTVVAVVGFVAAQRKGLFETQECHGGIESI